jgi:hypothetical protein
MPGTMTQGGEPNDLRFQFKVIEGLSESIRQQAASTERLATAMAEMQKTQVNMLERLATLEANKFATAIDGIKADVKVLMVEKSAFGMIKEWSPFLGMLLIAAVAVIVYGRMLGVVPAAAPAPTRVEATIQHDERRIEGVVGGKP